MEAGDPRLPARAAPPRLPESPIDSPARPLTAYLDTKALACRVLLSPARYTRPSLWDIRASSSSSTSIARRLAAAAALPGSREPGRRAGVAPADPCTDPRLDRLDADAGVNLAADRALPAFAGWLSRGGEPPPPPPPASRSLSIVPASIAAYRSMASSSAATSRRSRIARTGLGVGANDISRGGPGADFNAGGLRVDRRAMLDQRRRERRVEGGDSGLIAERILDPEIADIAGQALVADQFIGL